MVFSHIFCLSGALSRREECWIITLLPMPFDQSSPFSLSISRRGLFTLGGLATVSLTLPGCDLGSMFAVPPRDTVYFTPNDKFYRVNFNEGVLQFHQRFRC